MVAHVRFLPYNDSICTMLNGLPEVEVLAFKVGDSDNRHKFLGLCRGQLPKIIEVMLRYKRRPHVERLELVSKSAGGIMVLATLRKKEEDPITALYDFSCVLLYPIIIREGAKVFKLVAPRRRNLEDFISYMSNSGVVQPLKIMRASPDDLLSYYQPALKILRSLSPMQYRAVVLAVKRGYYRWRRDVKLSEIARELGITPQTLSEHLRKAENKIFSNLMEMLSYSVAGYD
ncbi:MAG: hypothetical protein DRN06_04150 [Thermoprotei archaeon]|nr:MAG: hypothetical protein DRN06_04150 [Thermoprotei archaeon]